jgi:hypothetical protein
MKALYFAFILILASAASVRYKPPYQVGVFVQRVAIDAGTVSHRRNIGLSGRHNVVTRNIEHTKTLVQTQDGQYSVEPPHRYGKAILTGSSGDHHKEWFMDALHPGDKLLFSADCDKHNHCAIEVPNPEEPDKVSKTVGWFYPNNALTNVTVLCGTGKLTDEVEAEVCPQPYWIANCQLLPNIANNGRRNVARVFQKRA